LGEIRHTEEVDEKYFLNGTLEKWEYLKGAKRIDRIRPNGEPYVFSEGAVSFPDCLNKPGRTMLTSESSVNRSTHVIEDAVTGRLRLLTPVECERLNGFEDNWTNTGMPEKSRYFTMGNALVVPVVEQIGKRLLEVVSYLLTKIREFL
jgi:DNA (cytosine-5)-methyltransferase 1